MSRNVQWGWKPKEDMLPALTISQPYASAIIEGLKTIELRTITTAYRGLLVIHAGLTWYGEPGVGKRQAQLEARETARRLGLPTELEAYPRGAILGVVDLVRSAMMTPQEWEIGRRYHRSEAPFAWGTVGWTVRNPRKLAEPVPYRGVLGLFAVPRDLVAELLDKPAALFPVSE